MTFRIQNSIDVVLSGAVKWSGVVGASTVHCLDRSPCVRVISRAKSGRNLCRREVPWIPLSREADLCSNKSQTCRQNRLPVRLMCLVGSDSRRWCREESVNSSAVFQEKSNPMVHPRKNVSMTFRATDGRVKLDGTLDAGFLESNNGIFFSSMVISPRPSFAGAVVHFRLVVAALFPHATPRVHPILSSLSHTTPLRCPAFLVSPSCVWHVVEPTEGPNTQTRQGLNSTALQMEMEDRPWGPPRRLGAKPRRRQFSKLLEAKRKCRQRARSSRPVVRYAILPWLLVKVFWLRDDSQVHTMLRLHCGPAGCGVLPVPGGVQRKLYVRLYTCGMTEAYPV